MDARVESLGRPATKDFPSYGEPPRADDRYEVIIVTPVGGGYRAVGGNMTLAYARRHARKWAGWPLPMALLNTRTGQLHMVGGSRKTR